MWSLLLIGISLGLIDSLNPFTISTQVVLHAFVKKTHHILYYIIGTFVTYWLGGICAYWGMDKIIMTFIGGFMERYSETVFSLEVILGIGLTIVGFFFLYRRIKKEKMTLSENQTEKKKVTAPKSVKPAFLFLIGASNTIGDLPTAFPYLIFIAKVSDGNYSIGEVLVLLAIYTLVYVMPLILMYLLYLYNKKKFEKIIEKVKQKLAGVSEWATIILPTVAGVALGIHGCMNLFP